MRTMVLSLSAIIKKLSFKGDEVMAEDDKTAKVKQDSENIDDVKAVSAIAYLGILFFVPMITNPKSKYAMFHANQGLMLLLAGIVLQVAAWILVLLSLGVLFFIPFLIWIYLLVMFILGIVNALNGKMQRLPLIGNYDIIKPQK